MIKNRISKWRGVTRYISTGLVAAAFLLATGCGEKDQAPSPKKPPLVSVEKVRQGEVINAIDLTGTVSPYRIAKLASPAEGPVMNLGVREGDVVKEGEKLLSIGRKQGVEASISSLREELRKEKDNLRRTRILVEKNALAGEELDLAKARFERARAELVKAQEKAMDYSLTAPWEGMVSKVMVRDGDFVTPRTPLVEIYDPQSLVIRTEVPEQYSAKLRENMEAMINLDAYPDSSFSARVVQVYPSLDERTRTRTIELSIKDEIKLLPGMFCRVRLIIESVQDALIVPEQAIVVTPSGESVVFVASEGKAVQRKVKTGIETERSVQIVEGVQAGELVLVAGHEGMKDDSRVRFAGDSKKLTPSANSGKDQ